MKTIAGICGHRAFLAVAHVGMLFSACVHAQDGFTPAGKRDDSTKLLTKTVTGVNAEGITTAEEFEWRMLFNAMKPDEVFIHDGRDHEQQSPTARLRNAHNGFSVVDVIFSGTKFPDLNLDDRQKSLVGKLVAERLLGRAADRAELQQLVENIDGEKEPDGLASFFKEVRHREQSREETLANGLLEVLLPKQFEGLAKQLLAHDFVRGLGNEIVAIHLDIDKRSQRNIQAAIVARRATIRRKVLEQIKQPTLKRSLTEDERDDLDLHVLKHLTLEQLEECLMLLNRIKPDQTVQDYVEEMSSSRQTRYARVWPDLRKEEG